jgi:hypothetical protein
MSQKISQSPTAAEVWTRLNQKRSPLLDARLNIYARIPRMNPGRNVPIR